MSALEIEGLGLTFGRNAPRPTLENFSLSVPERSLTVLLGESGCGKSTALNSIAGLAQPDEGRIRLGDKILFDAAGGRRRVHLPPEQRDIGMVFQSYALWPHMTVIENVMYPLLRRGHPREAARKEALAALAVVRCDALAERVPGALSGGQQQRVALARAITGRPRLLLFDEPLSNLDAGLRRELRDELGRLHRELGFTGVYVTHDQSEALALGTSMAVMNQGRIVQFGPPLDVYERPASVGIARFFGANILPGHASPGDGGLQVETPAGELRSRTSTPRGAVSVAFMPHAATLRSDCDGPLVVVTSAHLGAAQEIRLAVSGHEILVIRYGRRAPVAVGERFHIEIPPEQVHVYPA